MARPVLRHFGGVASIPSVPPVSMWAMDVLWAPWRMAYIGEPKPPGCIFCTNAAADDHRSALVLSVTEHVVVMMNKFPYANGHIMVAPQRHTADLDALAPREYADLTEALRFAMRVIGETLSPEGMNVGLNLGRAAGAGVEDHLHWHVVPRWIGDTNFMPLLGEVHVIPEHLESMYDRLAPRFADLDRALPS